MHKTLFNKIKPFTPKDKLTYIIPNQIIRDTERVLYEYAKIEPSNEGMVYWGGTKTEDKITVHIVIAPKTESGPGRVSVSHRSNFDFVGILNNYNFLHVAQVHSHPSNWVGHSMGDDQMAAFKTEGLLSIVVPEYCLDGMLPLVNCGIHRFIDGKFKQLSNKYVKTHFQLTDGQQTFFEDLR